MFPTFPPTSGVPIDLQALSGVTGSISIACWIVVFSPQILQNFRRQSADGLSLAFLIVWLLGDLFNILGAVLQGVLPTMIILAAYYTLADIVLLSQCLYYRHRTAHPDASHLSPATPLLDPSKDPSPPLPPQSLASAILFNATAIATVCLAGVAGWHLSSVSTPPPSSPPPLQFSMWGQIFGYLCAALYLASRVPQILMNRRRRSCDGISILFFLFAGIGNLTYVLSIVAYDGDDFGHYVLVNASWLLGSVGTLLLDMVIFGQFWVYGDGEGGVRGCESESESTDEEILV